MHSDNGVLTIFISSAFYNKFPGQIVYLSRLCPDISGYVRVFCCWALCLSCCGYCTGRGRGGGDGGYYHRSYSFDEQTGGGTADHFNRSPMDGSNNRGGYEYGRGRGGGGARSGWNNNWRDSSHNPEDERWNSGTNNRWSLSSPGMINTVTVSSHQVVLGIIQYCNLFITQQVFVVDTHVYKIKISCTSSQEVVRQPI